VFHFKPPVYPYLIAARVEQGAAWLARRMDEVGLLEAAARVRHHFGLMGERRSG
jgi:hypothetical protein